MKLTSSTLRIFLIAGIASTGNCWSSIDTATLRYWSPPSTCTEALFEEGKTCDRRETTVDINVTLDNTGATCYSNPMEYSPSGSSWFSWLGPDPNGDLNAYSLYVPVGQPVPQCDESGVCDPCEALDPIRGSDPANWFYFPNSTIKEMGYDNIAESPFMGSGCGTSQVYKANNLHPTNFCFPFQGPITVELGDPFACVNKGIVSAEACGAACDDGEGRELERSVFVKLKDGSPACCDCRYYGDGYISGVCGEEYSYMCSQNMDASSSNDLPAIHRFGTTTTVVAFMLLLWYDVRHAN